MASIQLGHEVFKVIEERLGPRLGKPVANTLLVLIILAIAVFCASVIVTYVAPFSKFIAGLIAGVKVDLTARDWEAGILTGLLTWGVFWLLMNAWMQGTRHLIQSLNESQATAREIINDVRATSNE